MKGDFTSSKTSSQQWLTGVRTTLLASTKFLESSFVQQIPNKADFVLRLFKCGRIEPFAYSLFGTLLNRVDPERSARKV